ncbi:ubiquitin carboxyl-terminal hydrolase isozyme L1 isoform X1 [Entelurus aequoreus]|uniref:ubiquitin carboxyl-terminal hydrolase isozyme L1 isoform X1 n=2 Tax=Entelurus aequoreus TaxID=161455 RepID=UPI002B1CE9B5|nr:ubiquitin carboxyl-terminal hydrolase isozyme L1 isoform X1 [Entelurus aequoreus]
MEWTPMEINPEVLNKLMMKLGVGKNWRFVDVLGLEAEPLSLVPEECCALMLLFPLTQQHESFRQQQADKVARGSDAYFLKQTSVNSCGTIALLHAVGNNQSKMTFEDGSVLKKFLDETAKMSAKDRAEHLNMNKAIHSVHNEVASQAQCVPEADKINFHFIAFVNINGQLLEFDGMMNGPLNHGPTKDNTLVTDAAKVCRDFVKRGQGELRFSAVALCRQ